VLFQREVFPIHEETIDFRELIDIHRKMPSKTFGIGLAQIDEPGLFAASATALTFEFFHKRKESRPL
jgi:hypothetical protein